MKNSHKLSKNCTHDPPPTGTPLIREHLSSVFNNFTYFNFQILAYKILKLKNNMAPELLTETTPKEGNSSLRNIITPQGKNIKTIMYDRETISSLGPKMWDILPTELKNIVSYIIRKESLWIDPLFPPKKKTNCPCCLCKTCV